VRGELPDKHEPGNHSSIAGTGHLSAGRREMGMQGRSLAHIRAPLTRIRAQRASSVLASGPLSPGSGRRQGPFTAGRKEIAITSRPHWASLSHCTPHYHLIISHQASLCVCVCARECVRACVRACVRRCECVRACARSEMLSLVDSLIHNLARTALRRRSTRKESYNLI
jgi:hypothetical protein